MLIGLALIVNGYGISGMTPIKGIAVPFLSYGGSQIVAHSIAIGMVLMISKKRVWRKKPQVVSGAQEPENRENQK